MYTSHLLTRKQSSLIGDVVVALSSENMRDFNFLNLSDPDLAGFTS